MGDYRVVYRVIDHTKEIEITIVIAARYIGERPANRANRAEVATPLRGEAPRLIGGTFGRTARVTDSEATWLASIEPLQRSRLFSA